MRTTSEKNLKDYIEEVRKNIYYDPLSDTYKIKVGDKIVVIPDYIMRAENANFLEKGVDGIEDERVRKILGLDTKFPQIDYTDSRLYEIGTSFGQGSGVCVGPQGPGVYADIKASLYSKSKYADTNSTGASSHNQGWHVAAGGYHGCYQWEATLLEQKAEDRIACTECDNVLRPFTEGFEVKVYYHDRYAGIPWNLLVDEAVKLLRTKKNMDIHIKYKCAKSDGAEVSYEVYSGTNSSKRVIACILLTPKAFDRRYTTVVDDFAMLMRKFDTHTYIMLRIAYILGFIYKLEDSAALKMPLPEVKVLRHITTPNI